MAVGLNKAKMHWSFEKSYSATNYILVIVYTQMAIKSDADEIS